MSYALGNVICIKITYNHGPCSLMNNGKKGSGKDEIQRCLNLKKVEEDSGNIEECMSYAL